MLSACGAVPKHFTPPAPPDVVESVRHVRIGNIGGCSGVAIDPHHALTAGHCVHPDEMLWFDGAPVKSAVVHEHLDVALLETPVELHGPFAYPGQDPQPGAVARIAGYGCSFPPLGQPRTREVRSLTFALRAPDTIYKPWDLIFVGLACRGDSGGGVFDVRGGLIGIVWGIMDATDERPPVVRATDAWAGFGLL